MNTQSKKSYLLQKIEFLIELMEEVHDKDEEKKKLSIFPEHYLEVQAIKELLENKTTLPTKELIMLNRIYREASVRKEMLEKENYLMEYEEYIEWKVKDILENEDIEYPYQDAAVFVKQNAVKKNGNAFTIDEAIEFVEQVREKNSIKKPKQIEVIVDPKTKQSEIIVKKIPRILSTKRNPN